MAESDNELPKEYSDEADKLLGKAKKNVEIQKKALFERVQKVIRKKEEYEFVTGMIEHLVMLSTDVTRVETTIRGETETIKNIHKLINTSWATKIGAILAYVRTSEESEE